MLWPGYSVRYPSMRGVSAQSTRVDHGSTGRANAAHRGGQKSRILRQQTDGRTMSRSSEPGIAGQPAGPGTRQLRRSVKRRLLAPFARFFGWWAGLFAFLAAFSVCPFCGQPGCAGGPAFAGLAGGVSALFLSFMRLGRRRRKAPPCGTPHSQHRADWIEKRAQVDSATP